MIQNRINISGVANTVYLLKPLTMDESTQIEHSKYSNT